MVIMTDHVRPFYSSARRGAPGRQNPTTGVAATLCLGTQAHPSPAMRLPGDFGNSDDAVEGCFATGGILSRQPTRKPCLHIGLPPSSP